MMTGPIHQRRDFLKKGLNLVVAMAAVKAAFFTDNFAMGASKKKKPKTGESEGGCTPPLADPKSGSANNLQYVHEKSKANAAIKVKRQGTKFENQFCKNCNFYKEAGDCQGKKVGTCTVIPGHVVSAEGICQTWMPKA